jgi:membrane protease subunit (stomatin/prohibitin family)
MGKVGDADFEAISSRLRARALTLMQDLARTPAVDPADRSAAARSRRACASCGTSNEPDAKFCKNCGNTLRVN